MFVAQPDPDNPTFTISFSCVTFKIFAVVMAFARRLVEADSIIRSHVQAFDLKTLMVTLTKAKVCCSAFIS
jgi:hypothetical protein